VNSARGARRSASRKGGSLSGKKKKRGALALVSLTLPFSSSCQGRKRGQEKKRKNEPGLTLHLFVSSITGREGGGKGRRGKEKTANLPRLLPPYPILYLHLTIHASARPVGKKEGKKFRWGGERMALPSSHRPKRREREGSRGGEKKGFPCPFSRSILLIRCSRVLEGEKDFLWKKKVYGNGSPGSLFYLPPATAPNQRGEGGTEGEKRKGRESIHRHLSPFYLVSVCWLDAQGRRGREDTPRERKKRGKGRAPACFLFSFSLSLPAMGGGEREEKRYRGGEKKGGKGGGWSPKRHIFL